MQTPATKAQEHKLTVPADKSARDAIRQAVQIYCAGQTLVPPLALEEIEAHADCVLQAAHIETCFRGFVTVLVGNEVWRDTLAATPFERRVLLLPQCLRSSTACPAESDALGLLCETCGRCAIGGIQKEAERLGYSVLVAEGTTVVSALLAGGKINAVVGVSCLEALEKSFRPLVTHAVPALAVPLLRDGCVDTEADSAWILELLRLRSDAPPAAVRMDMRALRREVSGWFEHGALDGLLNLSGSVTEDMALEWMAKGGKRWRPTLAACVFKALTDPSAGTPGMLKLVAVAVECFHKASLIHDDIEDGDDFRYDAPTLHRRHGVEVAINVGDLLIGEGYRLIAASGAPAGQVHQMLAVAAGGHRTLCIGQGQELLLRGKPERVTVDAVLEIFRRKTAPAYDVALQLGAICAGADRDTRAILTAFSEALGVAYQIRDDLEDVAADHPKRLNAQNQPSLLLALEHEELSGSTEPVLNSVTPERIQNAFDRGHERSRRAEQQARKLLRQYEDRALRSLRPLRQTTLKSLLYRVAAKILSPAPAP
ncbi:MAG: polyprenyl synthetase family protein [bacterium]